MKKIILILLTLSNTYLLFGQVVMSIDSVDISRPKESLGFVVTSDFRMVFRDDPDERIVPTIRIVATLENNSNDDIWIRAQFFHKAIEMRFRYHGKDYYKYGTWIESDNYYPSGLLLGPNESKRIILGFVAPMNTPENFTLLLSSTYPNGWNWKQEKISDRMYLRWFKEILPSLTTIITYDSIWGDDYKLSSNPINLKKVIFTSNLTDKKLN